jgi:5-epi-alpha-selinene synthase
MRRKTSALYIFFDLIELADHVNLPVEVLEHEHIRNLKMLANDGVAWFNDIVSLEKEIKAGDIHNLVLVMQHEYQVDLQEAVNRASSLFNAMIEAYIELEADTPSFGEEVDVEVQRYLAGLRCWMRGNIDWSYETGRYGQAVMAVGG